MNFIKKHLSVLKVFLLYLLTACIFTYPLVFKLTSSLYGYTSDNFSAAWYFWWFKFAYFHHLDPNFSPYVNAPFGIFFGTQALEIFWMSLVKLLTFFSNELLAMNLMFLLSFPLAGLSMYFLTQYFNKSTVACLLAGLIFTFAPYHFWQGYAHISLTFIYTIPIFLLALFHLNDKPSFKASIWLSLSFLLVFLNTFYYGLFMIVVSLSFFVIQILFSVLKKEKYLTPKRFKAFFIAGLLAVVLLLPSILDFYTSLKVTFTSSSGTVNSRTIDDFLSLSLRPWDLFLPAPDHPIFGNLSKEVYKWISHLGNDYKTISAFLPERVVYLGVIPTLLALMGILVGLRNSNFRPKVLLLVALLVIVSLIALPPLLIIKGVNFYLPSYFIYLFLSPLRALVRFGVVILLLVSLLASFGFRFLLARFPRRKIVLTMFIFGAVLFEFLPFPPAKITSFENPPAYYQWVKELKEDVIIAEYPKRFDVADALIWQRYHQKRIFNMFNDEYAQLWEYVGNPEGEDQSDLLSSLGVKYVIFHTEYLYPTSHPFDDLYFTRFATPPTVITKNGEKIDIKEYPWLKLVEEYPDARIYELRQTNSKFISFNPNRSSKLSFLNDNKLELDQKENKLYLFNFGKEIERVSLDYQLKGDKQKLSSMFYNGIWVEDLNHRVLEIKPGLNTLKIVSSCPECKVGISDIEARLVN